VYDVKMSQLGRKNLAVRFDMYQISAGSQKPPVAGREEIGSSSTCLKRDRGIETSQCPPLRLGEGGHSRRDMADSGIQRVSDGAVISKHSNHNNDDASRNDHVLERHHAVLVRAQALHRFAGLDVILQHMRNFLLLDVTLHWLRTSQPPIGKTCHQLGSNI